MHALNSAYFLTFYECAHWLGQFLVIYSPAKILSHSTLANIYVYSNAIDWATLRRVFISNWIIKDTLFPAYKLTFLSPLLLFFNEGSSSSTNIDWGRKNLIKMQRRIEEKKAVIKFYYFYFPQYFCVELFFISLRIEINSASFLINWWISVGRNQ